MAIQTAHLRRQQNIFNYFSKSKYTLWRDLLTGFPYLSFVISFFRNQ